MTTPRIGFRFVPMPIEVWDGTNNDLTLGEFRLYGYLIRHQIRLGAPVIAITYDELVNGVWWPASEQQERRRVDFGCGLVRNAIKKALELLEKRGWIEVNDVSKNSRPNLAVRVIFDEEKVSRHDTFENGKVSQHDTSNCHNVTLSSDPSNTLVEEVVEPPLSPPQGGARKVNPAIETLARSFIKQTIFPYYIQTVKPEAKVIYTLTKQRLDQGTLRLLECRKKCNGNWEGAEKLMKVAIDTMAASDFHMGRLAKTGGRQYNDWKHLFRSAEKLEEWFVRSGEDAHAER